MRYQLLVIPYFREDVWSGEIVRTKTGQHKLKGKRNVPQRCLLPVSPITDNG